MDFLKRYKKMISLRGLTDHTVKSYCTYISAYLDYISDTLHKYPSQVTYNDQRRFLDHLKEDRGLSDRSINCAISQIRFFTMYVLHKPWDPTQLPMRKFDTYLPYVPSQEEVRTFIETIPDIKVKAMAALMYSSGLLFPKQTDPSRPIDTFFVSRHIHDHEEELGRPKRITCHTFRHAFGTHLYENGADLMTIKTLMGHKSITSTAIYVHLAVSAKNSPVSPFDQIGGSSE